MSSSPVISVENLGKKYRIHHRQDGGMRYNALREVLADKTKAVARRLWKAVRNPLGNGAVADNNGIVEDFWALKDVSFEMKQGEVLGIIGRNGAGKSTLLKILSRITEPTEGRVRIKGRIASLLEVGTGFHPELTGRENIFLNGAILGMRKAEIKSKFDEIVAFAEIEKFLDTPVKRYSSGMYVRLAFAVAAHLEPEILIVDEVLAVGDAEFQKKCLGKMESISRSEGRTILFVSHNIQAVRNLCSRGILLREGRKVMDANVERVVELYVGPRAQAEIWTYDTSQSRRRIAGSELARIEKVWFTAKTCRVQFGEPLRVRVELVAAEPLADTCFDLTVFTQENTSVGTAFSTQAIEVSMGRSVYQLTIPYLRLAPGRYYCDLAILKGNWLRSPSVHDVVLGILQFEIDFPRTERDTMPVWHANWGANVFQDISVSEVRRDFCAA